MVNAFRVITAEIVYKEALKDGLEFGMEVKQTKK